MWSPTRLLFKLCHYAPISGGLHRDTQFYVADNVRRISVVCLGFVRLVSS